jgi:acetoin utilization protein AcuB
VVANEAMDTASLDVDFSIGDVMTRNPTVVTVDDTLETVISILAEGKFQAVPVTKDGLLHGIVTNKDLVRIYKWQLENN